MPICLKLCLTLTLTFAHRLLIANEKAWQAALNVGGLPGTGWDRMKTLSGFKGLMDARATELSYHEEALKSIEGKINITKQENNVVEDEADDDEDEEDEDEDEDDENLATVTYAKNDDNDDDDGGDEDDDL